MISYHKMLLQFTRVTEISYPVCECIGTFLKALQKKEMKIFESDILVGASSLTYSQLIETFSLTAAVDFELVILVWVGYLIISRKGISRLFSFNTFYDNFTFFNIFPHS